MAKALLISELGELLNYVHTHHSPFRKTNQRLRTVKYVDPHIDMRTGEVFSIEFRGFFEDKVFTVVNEGRFHPDPLLTQIMSWLQDTSWINEN